MNFADALRGFVALLWLIVIGLIALAVMRAYRGRAIRATTTAIIVTAAAAILLTTISAGLVFIEPDKRGVVISAVEDRGIRQNAVGPGLVWIIPFFERVQEYPISRQTYTMAATEGEGQVAGEDSIAARTSDGQEVFVDASVIYSVDPSQVVKVHVEWQDRYHNDLIRPLARGVIRDAISQYGVEEVYSSQRNEMTQTIREVMGQRMSDNGLVLVEFVLRNITFSPEYAASVEQKQIAEQLAQQAAFVVEQRKQEAEQARQVAQGAADASVIRAEGDAQARIIEAEAETQALNMIAQAVNANPDLLTYNYINKLAPGIQVMLVPNDTPFMLPLPNIGPQQTESLTPEPTTAAPSAPPTTVITPTQETEPAAP
jgi:regulator of protease activity HflC (stomatin/prohibitin superfamily)